MDYPEGVAISSRNRRRLHSAHTRVTLCCRDSSLPWDLPKRGTHTCSPYQTLRCLASHPKGVAILAVLTRGLFFALEYSSHPKGVASLGTYPKVVAILAVPTRDLPLLCLGTRSHQGPLLCLGLQKGYPYLQSLPDSSLPCNPPKRGSHACSPYQGTLLCLGIFKPPKRGSHTCSPYQGTLLCLGTYPKVVAILAVPTRGLPLLSLGTRSHQGPLLCLGLPRRGSHIIEEPQTIT